MVCLCSPQRKASCPDLIRASMPLRLSKWDGQWNGLPGLRPPKQRLVRSSIRLQGFGPRRRVKPGNDEFYGQALAVEHHALRGVAVLPASPLKRRRVVFLHGIADAKMADEHPVSRHIED